MDDASKIHKDHKGNLPSNGSMGVGWGDGFNFDERLGFSNFTS